MYVETFQNEHGVDVSRHVCGTCGNEFTVTPAKESWGDCRSKECASYDPDKDILRNLPDCTS